jgi:D-lyxose ketol-isomerase
MRRSEINRILQESIDFAREHRFHLPPFASWTPAQWAEAGHEYDEIRDCVLGWDITDFGSGRFAEVGLMLFTIRNGSHGDARYHKPYCEKLLVCREGQVTPMHFHWAKTEDIICRAGGNLMMQVYNATPDERLADTPVPVSRDGRNYSVPAGTVIRLEPGESVTLPSGNYHSFWGEGGHGWVLIGEVSRVNDDAHDNRFLEPVGRFPAIDEDEPPLRLLCNEYPPAP